MHAPHHHLSGPITLFATCANDPSVQWEKKRHGDRVSDHPPLRPACGCPSNERYTTPRPSQVSIGAHDDLNRTGNGTASPNAHDDDDDDDDDDADDDDDGGDDDDDDGNDYDDDDDDRC